VQKYENGINRVSASRLSAIADILGVRIAYFFDDYASDEPELSAEEKQSRELLQRPKTVDLIRLHTGLRISGFAGNSWSW